MLFIAVMFAGCIPAPSVPSAIEAESTRQAAEAAALAERFVTRQAAEAVALAERFAARNGYTEAAAVPPLAYESIERGRTDEEILAARRGTLSPKAYGVLPYSDGWLVVFRYIKTSDSSDAGRAVTMDFKGQDLGVQPQGISLSAVAEMSNFRLAKDVAESIGDETVGIPPDTIQVHLREDHYVLTVPVSRLTMNIPRAGFSQRAVELLGGATSNPRYFYFVDPSVPMYISGWFEPAEKYAGVQEFWEDEVRAWERDGLPEPLNVSIVRIGNWDAIVYDIASEVRVSAHIRANWIQAGTWIDIHLSILSSESSQDAREELVSLLESILVTEKN